MSLCARRLRLTLRLFFLLCFALPGLPGRATPAANGRQLRKELSDILRTPQRFEEKIVAIEALRSDDSSDAVRALINSLTQLVSKWDKENGERNQLASDIHEVQSEMMTSGPVRFIFGEQTKEKYDADRKRFEELGRRRDGEQRMIRTIIDVLASFEQPSTIKALSNRLRERDPRIKCAIIEALAQSKSEDLPNRIPQILRDTNPRVRVAALDAILTRRLDGHTDRLLELARDQKSWVVRASALRVLAELETPTIEELIPRLTAEPGRLRQDVADALERLTGEEFGTNPGAWSNWWKEQGNQFNPKRPRRSSKKVAPRDPVRYYGLDTLSRRIVFVIDTSESMKQKNPGRAREESSSGRRLTTKLDSAKAELKRVLSNLDSTDRFGLVVYNDIVVNWRREMVLATPGNLEAARAYVDNLYATDNTNIYEALEAGFNVEGFGKTESYFREGVDTIFLLTDGAPSIGRILEPEKILRQVRIWNRHRNVVIHCVGLGRDHNAPFLRNLARENRGRYVSPN